MNLFSVTEAQCTQTFVALLDSASRSSQLASREADPASQKGSFLLAATYAAAAVAAAAHPVQRKTAAGIACANFVLASSPLEVWRPFLGLAANSKAKIEPGVQETINGILAEVRAGTIRETLHGDRPAKAQP